MAATRVGVGDTVKTADMNDSLIARIGSANTQANSAGTTSTTPTSVLTLTVNVVAGKTYAVVFTGRISSAAGDFAIARLKTVNASGTDLNHATLYVGNATGAGLQLECYGEYTAASTGSVVFVATLERVSGGTGTVTLRASSTGPAFLYVDYLGL
jgi:hypothetical protein